MRIVKVVAVLLAAAFGASAVALAVERPAKEDDAESVVSVSGVLTAKGRGFEVAGKELGLGPPWWRESGKAADFDGDGAVETVVAELASLTGKTVTVTGAADDEGELSVRSIAG
jgi:hypothetical protein